MSHVGQIVAFVGSGGLAAGVTVGVGWLRRFGQHRRRVEAIYDVVVGTPADPIRGRDAQPGVAARLDVLERRTAQLVPNGGSSIYDRVTRIEADLAAHLREHGASS